MGSAESMECPPGDGNSGLGADRRAAREDVLNHFDGQLVDGHARDGEREDRLRAHGVDVGEGVGRGDAAEVEGVVHDGQEEIGGHHDGLLRVEAIDGGVIGGLGSDEKIGERGCYGRRV